MDKTSISSSGADQPTPNSSGSGVEQSRTQPEHDLRAPHGLGEAHPIEQLMGMLNELHSLVEQPAIGVRPNPSMPNQMPGQAPYVTVPHAHAVQVNPAAPSMQPQANAVTNTSSSLTAPREVVANADAPTTTPTKQTPPAPTNEARDAQNKAEKTQTPEKSTKTDSPPTNESSIDKAAAPTKQDVQPKDPVQALEKAIDSILKGYTSTTNTQEIQTQPLARPQEQTQTSHAQPTSEQVKPSTSTEQMQTPQQRPEVEAHSVSQRPEPQQPLESSTHHPQTTQQAEQSQQRIQELRLDQAQQQRAEQIQLIHQILLTQVEQILPTQLQPQTEQLHPSIHPRHESTTIAVETLRDSVLEKLTAIQSQFETVITERRKIEAINAEPNTRIQGRGDLLTQEPLRHDIKPSLDLRHTDRANDPSPLARLVREIAPALAHSIAPAAMASAQGATPTSILGARSSVDALSGLFDLLKRFSERSNNGPLLQRLNSPLDKACLSLVTGAALGVVGIELLLRAANLALAELLRALREEKKRIDLSEEERVLIEEVTPDLETHVHNVFIEPIQAGLVADVSGTIIDSSTQQPIQGVLIGSAELGSTISNQQGRFVFKNVTLGSAYTLNFYKLFYTLTPDTLNGVCSPESHHHVVLQLTPLGR